MGKYLREKGEPPIPKNVNKDGALVIYALVVKTLDKEVTDDESHLKKLKVLIPTPTPLKSILSESTPLIPTPTLLNSIIPEPTPPKDPTPPRDESKGKGIATKEPLKELMPFIEGGGSEPKITSLRPFITLNVQMTNEEIIAQVKEMKRLADLQAEEEKAEKRPIIKINYRFDSVSKDATMRIEKDNQPLSLVVLKNLAKFEWIKTQARKLSLPPPPELSAFRLSAAKKKRKRTSELIKEVFVKEDIMMDGMYRNLIPPQGVVGSRGLVITDAKSRIFFYNGGTPKTEEMFKKLDLTIEARNDVNQARIITRDNLDGGGIIFQTRCKINQDVFNVIIDKGSSENIISWDVVARLKLIPKKHSKPYNIGWIKSVGEKTNANDEYYYKNEGVIVLGVYLHCEACVSVEEVELNMEENRVIVKGTSCDPVRIAARVKRKQGKRVVIISPVPIKKQEKKEEPPKVTEMVLKMHMHCEGYAEDVRHRLQKMKEVKSAKPDMNTSTMTVKGTVDPKIL
nr:hypothetical protein [Tanacetum cinerariifolium]